ncbi:MAG: SURF1 family protein [Pseudomonadota bacterium]|nr:SURF1 family protein [Pseudomonadota bacterium]
MALGIAILASLGTWQLNRLDEAAGDRVRFSERLAEPPFDAFVPPADPDLRRVRVRGVPDWERHVLLAGKYMWGDVGYQVIVPVRGAEAGPTSTVLVNVGWVPADEVELILARERAVAGVQVYEGLARAYPEDPSAKGSFPVEGGFQRHWRAISPKAMAGGGLVPSFVVFEGEGLETDAPITDRVPPIGGWRMEAPERPHFQYAVTWYSLMLTLLLVWLSASVQRDAAPPEPRA